MPARVFVSYRRDDAGHQAGRLAQSLEAEFGPGSVFFDTSSLEAGAPWPAALRSAVGDASAFVVVIGPNWLQISDRWGFRRIDDPEDWVFREIELALVSDRHVIPVFVDDAAPLRADKLPPSISALADLQGLTVRRDHWLHDVELVVANVRRHEEPDVAPEDHYLPYPKPSRDLPDPLPYDKIVAALNGSLSGWTWRSYQVEFGSGHVREEFHRAFTFPTFQAAVDFMARVAPGCDIANHHPHWENLFRTLYVHLTTFDIGHRISDRDVQLAKYFDKAYGDFIAERSAPG